jgi:hypothetical protein
VEPAHHHPFLMKKKHTKEQKIRPQKPSYMKKGLRENGCSFFLGMKSIK